MAIQLPDVGTGVPADQTGDSPWLAMKKVRENFNDQTNAASRIVGQDDNQIPLAKDVSVLAFSPMIPPFANTAEITANVRDIPFGLQFAHQYATGKPVEHGEYSNIVTFRGYGTTRWQIAIPYNKASNRFYIRAKLSSPDEYEAWSEIYHSTNTTKDSNGFLKASSPIVKVFADKAELNSDAVNQNVAYKKNGVGDYTITTVSGLSTDGWYIELPKDMNGNPKVAVTLEETDGVISLKSYKRIFSMETFTFEPDLDNPLDIPDTRWIDLRLNEIPIEAQEELPTDGG